MSSTTQTVIRQIDTQYLISNPAVADAVSPQWFSAEYWQAHALVETIGTGRGAAWFIHTQDDDYVLRHYRRGGMVARLLHDRYIWRGLDATRAVLELQLLAHLQSVGLPAPQPVAARVVQHGLFYSADIIMRRIVDSVALSALLQYRQLDASVWHAIGHCIRRFHDAHINHADLNAHNVLLTAADHVYLIDFDRGRVDQGGSWQEKNLQRLHRSLNKLLLENETFYFTATNWEALLDGYNK